jgi:N-acetylmuramoyl-L-alanine amidase
MGDDAESGVNFVDYPAAQIDVVLALVKDIASRTAIAPHRILGHSDIAPQLRPDPGPKFPWRRLADAGLIPWPDQAQVASAMTRLGQTPPDAAWFQSRRPSAMKRRAPEPSTRQRVGLRSFKRDIDQLDMTG